MKKIKSVLIKASLIFLACSAYATESKLPATCLDLVPVAVQGDLNIEEAKLNSDFPEVNQKLMALKKEFMEAVRVQDLKRTLLAVGEVSNYAASLITQHKNKEFFYLVSLTSFPINKSYYEDMEIQFFYFGSSLLEASILAKNYEVFAALPSLTQTYNWPASQYPHINRWTQQLTRAVKDDPIFSKEAHSIETRRGSPAYNKQTADYMHLAPNTLELFKSAKVSNSLDDLRDALARLFPSGRIGVDINDQKDPGRFGTLNFLESDGFIHIAILDDKYFRKGWFGGGRYTKEASFNLQMGAHEFQDAGPGETRKLVAIRAEGQKINWIREMEVNSTSVRILLERDQLGKKYEGSRGTTFQEVTFEADNTGRLVKIHIRNGNQLWLKHFWLQQSITLPETAVSFSGVSFAGEEDMSQEILE